MQAFPKLFFIFLLFLFATLSAEDEDPLKKFVDEAEKKKPGAKDGKIDLSTISNASLMSAFKDFCESKPLKYLKYGKGQFNLISAGDWKLTTADSLLKLADKSFQLMDKWTGSQKIFLPEEITKETTYNVVIFNHPEEFKEFVSFLMERGIMRKPEGDDLTAELENVSFTRTSFLTRFRFEKVMKNLVVHSAASLGLETFFKAANDQKAPPFFKAGFSAELQKTLCKNQVLVYTISYEINDIDPRKNWAREMSRMIKKKDKYLRKASNVTEMDFVGRSIQGYIQMWSLCTLFNRMSRNKKGDTNKLFQLMVESARNPYVYGNVMKIFKVKEPSLTNQWRRWAASQKK